MSYTMYTPLNVWLDPASMTDVVAYIQTYLRDNPIYSTTEIETLIHDYLIAHPELIGGVQSVNGKTGTVVLSASDINTENNVTIESVLSALGSQISTIAANVATNTNNITSLTGRVSTAETDLANLKSNLSEETNLNWFRGWYGASTGLLNVTRTDAIASHKFGREISKVECPNTYKFRIQAWENNTYTGIWNGTTFVKSNPQYYVTSFDFSILEESHPNAFYAVVLFREDNTSIEISEGINAVFTYNKTVYIEQNAPYLSTIKYYGNSIAPQTHGIRETSIDQTLPNPVSGTSARQGGDAYNGVLYILCSNDKALLVNLNNSTKIGELDIKCDHGNSCQFGTTIQGTETTPRLFCFGYENNNVYENSIENNTTTLQRTYTLPITGYRISGGYDAERNRLMTIHYKNNSSTDATDNYCIVSVWDLTNATSNQDGTYTPILLMQYDTAFIGVIQDCKVYNGRLYVLSGQFVNQTYPATIITVFGVDGLYNAVTVYPANGNEPEELVIVENNRTAFIYIGDSRLHALQFVD